ncbi:retrovirus-related pol polyprotein from transposon TNT 1-94 [Tanacetum coccineum]
MCSKVTLDQLLSEQIQGNIVKALRGRGKRKEKISSKKVIFTKADESSSMPFLEITSDSESECKTQEPLPPLPKLIGAALAVSLAYVIKKQTKNNSSTIPDKKAESSTQQLLLTLMEEAPMIPKPFKEGKYYEINDHHFDNCEYYPGCEVCGIIAHEPVDCPKKHPNSKKPRIANKRSIEPIEKYSKEPGPKVVFGDDTSVAKAFRVFNIRRQEMEETVHVTFSEDDEAISQSSTEGDAINFNENRSFLDDEFLEPRSKDSVSTEEPPEFTIIDDQPESDDNLELTKIQNNITDEIISDSREKHIEQVNIIGEPLTSITTKSRVRDSKASSAHECLYVNFLSEMEPKKLIEALEEEGWIIAMQEELNQFKRNKVWTLVPKPYGKTIIGTKWIWKNEMDENEVVIKNKARLAAQAYMGFMVNQMDVKSAFLNGKILEEMYVQQPPGFESSEFPNHICKLDKDLYGLKQAFRVWYETLSKFLIQHKFVRGQLVLCLEAICQDFKGNSVCQEKYVKDLLKKYDLVDSTSMKCPMFPPNNLGPDESRVSVTETLFKGMIGSLMYLTASRPPNSPYVSILGLWYPKGSGFDLKAYSDSDYAGSSAEYVATAGCCVQVLWIKSQLAHYDLLYDKVSLFCDNTSAIAISNNLILHSRTKHIDIRYHFIRDHILKGDIELYFVPTDLQPADIFIKPLAEPSFTRLVAELEVDDATKTITFSLSSFEKPLSFTQDEFISAIRLPACSNDVLLPPKETVKAGLANLDLINKDKTTLSSTIVGSHDQLNLNWQTIAYYLIWGLEVDIRPEQSLIISSEKVNADDIADKSLSGTTMLSTKVDNLESTISKKVSEDVQSSVPSFTTTTLKNLLRSLLLEALKETLPSMIQTSIQQAVQKPIEEQLQMFKEHNLQTLQDQLTNTVKDKVRKGMQFVSDKLSSIQSSVATNAQHVSDLRQALQDINILLESTEVLKKANAEDEEEQQSKDAHVANIQREQTIAQETTTVVQAPESLNQQLKTKPWFYMARIKKTTSSNFSPTPPREPTPPRDESKGKGITSKEPLKDLIPYIEKEGSVPQIPKLKSFITLNKQLTQEDIMAQVKEMKRLVDLKAEKEKS